LPPRGRPRPGPGIGPVRPRLRLVAARSRAQGSRERAIAMTPPSPIPSTPSTPADRLEALADAWQDITGAAAARPIPTPELDLLRKGLSELAAEAEAGDQCGRSRAVRRIALLTEGWECLESGPERGYAGEDVAGFCLEAMRCRARDRRVGAPGREEGVGEEILRQSDERWGDYLSPLDSSSADPTLADEPDSFEDPAIAQDEPPAL